MLCDVDAVLLFQQNSCSNALFTIECRQWYVGVCIYTQASQDSRALTSFVFSAVSLLDEKKEEGVPHFHFTKGGADDIRVMNRVYMKRIVASSITPSGRSPQIVCMYYGLVLLPDVHTKKT